MPNEWKQARTQIKAFKQYYDALPQAAKDKTVKSYVISRSQIESLLSQQTGAGLLDGLRIYVGLDTSAGQPVPVLHIIASKLVSGSFDDYGIPESGIDLETDDDARVNTVMPLKATTFPCPTHCAKTNVLNS